MVVALAAALTAVILSLAPTPLEGASGSPRDDATLSASGSAAASGCVRIVRHADRRTPAPAPDGGLPPLAGPGAAAPTSIGYLTWYASAPSARASARTRGPHAPRAPPAR